jgi:hypothetical protein
MKIKPFKGLILLILLFTIPAWAEDIYVSQSGAGSVFTTSCAIGSRSIAWLNSSGFTDSISNSDGLVGPGDTVHLCSNADFTTALIIGASGLSGNPITIHFAPNAKFSKPSWNTGIYSGIIYGGTHNYIIIDGGQNGIIECTDNGTLGTYSNQQGSIGILFDSSINTHDIEIKNLTIRNLYVRTSNADYNTYAYENNIAIRFSGANNNISIHHCTIHHSPFIMTIHYRSNSANWSIYNNTFYSFHTLLYSNCVETTTDNLTGFYYYNNSSNYSHDYNQTDDVDRMHADHIHFSGDGVDGSHGSLTTVRIYGNTFGPEFPYGWKNGEPWVRSTSCIYLSNEGGVTDSVINNNLFYALPTELVLNTNGFLSAPSPEGKIFNNTFIGISVGNGTAIDAYFATDPVVKNNIFVKIRNAIYLAGKNFPESRFDYNIYGVGYDTDFYDDNTHSSHGVDPILDTNYIPTIVDTLARDRGLDLSAYFTTDKLGNTRTGTWDIGAYEYAGPGGSATGLTILGGVTIQLN